MLEAPCHAIEERRAFRHLPPPVEGKCVEQNAEEDDQEPALPDRPRLLARELGGHTDDEKEEGKDQIRRRPAMSLGVRERPPYGAPRTGVVHEEHCRDGRTAEGVESLDA